MPIQYLKSSGNLLGWLIARAAAQALLTIVLARALGANSYGLYIGIIAVASFLTPFAGMGLSNIVLRNASKDPKNLDYYFSKALSIWAISSGVSIIFAWILAKSLLPNAIPWIAAFAVIAAEVISNSISELYARYLQAQNRINLYGLINFSLPAIRLLLIGIMISSNDEYDVTHVLWVHTICAMLFTIIIWKIKPNDKFQIYPTEILSIKSGFPFSLAMFSNRMQNEFNKPLLARIGFESAGNYNIAQRVIDLASIPLVALQETLWPKLYAYKEPLPRLVFFGSLMLIVAGLVGVFLWMIAPVLPIVLGSDYSNSIEIIRSLAWLPLLQVLRNLINFHIINENALNILSWTYSIGALTSIAGSFLLIPTHGLMGAVSIAYITELTMIFVLIFSTYLLRLNNVKRD